MKRYGGATPRPCNLVIASELILKKGDETAFCTPFFFVAARTEDTRDLLLLPNPTTAASTWLGHYVNNQIARIPFFWHLILQACCELRDQAEMPTVAHTVAKVAMNFGTWEKAQHRDHRAIDCHGHVHLELTAEAHIALCRDYWMLEGRDGDPAAYRLENCKQLEADRVTPMALQQLAGDVKLLKTGMETLTQLVRRIPGVSDSP